MKILEKMCYTHLSWLQRQEKFLKSINSVKFSKPLIDFEGIAGYIETDVEFEVIDIKLFAEIYYNYYGLDDHIKMSIRSEIMNGKMC